MLVPNCLFMQDPSSRTPCKPRKVFSPQTRLSIPSACAALVSAASFSLAVLLTAADEAALAKPPLISALRRNTASADAKGRIRNIFKSPRCRVLLMQVGVDLFRAFDLQLQRVAVEVGKIESMSRGAAHLGLFQSINFATFARDRFAKLLQRFRCRREKRVVLALEAIVGAAA